MTTPIAPGVSTAPSDKGPEFQLEHFKHLCEQTRYFYDKFTESFSQFIQSFSLLIGGCIYVLATKELQGVNHNALILLSDAIVALLVAGTLIRMLGHMVAWWGYRKMQHKIYLDVPAPSGWRSCWLELGMAKIVAVAGVAFCYFNPFSYLT